MFYYFLNKGKGIGPYVQNFVDMQNIDKANESLVNIISRDKYVDTRCLGHVDTCEIPV